MSENPDMGHPAFTLEAGLSKIGLLMSFWDLAHGRSSNLLPPKDLSVTTPQAAGIAGAAIATAGLLLTALYRPQDLGKAAPLLRLGYQAKQGGDSAAEKRLTENEHKAALRRELGCAYLEKRAQRDPSPPNFCRLARARFATGKLRGALDAARRALEADNNHPEARLLIIFYHLRLGDVAAAELAICEGIPQKGDTMLYHAIVDHLKKTKLEMVSRGFLEAAVACDAADFKAWEKLGFFHEHQQDFTSSVQAYEQAHTLSSNIALPWHAALQHGKQAVAQGRLNDAEALYEKASRFKPNWPELLTARALLAKLNNEPQLALSYLNGILRCDESHAQALFLSGNMHAYLGDDETATALWTKSFSVDESMPVPWKLQYDNGLQLCQQGKFREALGEFEAAQARCESWQKPKEAAGQVRAILSAILLERDGDDALQAGDFARAMSRWQESVNLHSKNPNLLMKLGALHADAGESAVALELFEKALVLGHPNAALTSRVCKAYLDFVPEVGPEGVRV